MAIRNLDWSSLDLDSDPAYADPDVVSAAQKRYSHIATTIDDATAKLGQIVDSDSDSLAGQYVEGLKSEAGTLKDSLGKAAVRYHDVANEIGKYEPDLDRGLSETAGALQDADEAQGSQTKAKGLPDPTKSPDGTITPEEQQKGTDKEKANSEADSKMAAAKTRLNNAVDALNVAGKRFGDAVSARRYTDGLTDSYKDKLDAVMAKISQIFAIIGMILGVLAILIPGVNVIVIAGVVAGAVTLIANIVLYVDGKGSVLDVVLGAVGLGLAGLGAIVAVVGKGISSIAKAAALANRPGGAGGIQLVPLRPPAGSIPNFSRPFGAGNPRPGGGVPNFSRPFGPNNRPGNVPGRPAPGSQPAGAPPPNVAADWQNTSKWFNNPATNWLLGKFGATTPEIGFWASNWAGLQGAGKMWGTLLSDPAKFGKDFASILGGIKGPLDLSAITKAAGLGGISSLWFVWGGVNGAFGIGAGFIYTGGRLVGWIPAVNPPGQAAS
ncbi:hypothetical protein C8250_002525 [Streptomyces sp. So13.3]|uniref:DUF308 domain-containing protein n=1 Tax=unclassified Streptomyces TaxID=2593676 RepID=UPI001105E6C9|nr:MULTISPECIES: DUF308 domain-containing protein [unclassified Streptomyces]MCZ4099702.1 hypothetical protein [Streptomyces sp. H39-C1]QNA70955.1 hypothetical protein C8250_002525 [Streptomyces sp. So13.3]